MPIIGFNFDKILVERTGVVGRQINVKHNLSLKDIKKNDLAFGANKRPVLRFDFLFAVEYEELGNLTMNGHVLFLEEDKKVKEVLDNWGKDKKIEPKLAESILNAILIKCNIKALMLAQEVNLPPHFNMPRLAPGAKSENYIG